RIMMSGGMDDPLRSLRNRFVEDELVHLLIGTAIANRIQFEHMSGPRNDPSELSYQPLDHACGQLQRDVTSSARVPLLFQEACNKIIHGLNIVAQTSGVPEETALGTVVAFRGLRRSDTWLVHLDLVEY